MHHDYSIFIYGAMVSLFVTGPTVELMAESGQAE